MTIEAVIAYLERGGPAAVGAAELEDVVAQAAAAGLVFSAGELRSTLQVRDLLAQVRRDETLRSELLAAPAKLHALAGIARQRGHACDAAAISEVLRAARRRAAELDAAALDRVVGGGGRGYALPEVDDEVLLSFAQGDIHAPVVLGSLWSSKDRPPG